MSNTWNNPDGLQITYGGPPTSSGGTTLSTFKWLGDTACEELETVLDFTPTTIVYSSSWSHTSGNSSLGITTASAQALASSNLNTDYLCIDVESWHIRPSTDPSYSSSENAQSIANYRDFIRDFKAVNTHTKLGLWQLLPKPDIRYVFNSSWVTAYDSMYNSITAGLGAYKPDFSWPNFYWGYDNPDHNLEAFRMTVSATRNAGIANIYPAVWHRGEGVFYTGTNSDPNSGNLWLDNATLRVILDYVEANCDGLVWFVKGDEVNNEPSFSGGSITIAQPYDGASTREHIRAEDYVGYTSFTRERQWVREVYKRKNGVDLNV